MSTPDTLGHSSGRPPKSKQPDLSSRFDVDGKYAALPRRVSHASGHLTILEKTNLFCSLLVMGKAVKPLSGKSSPDGNRHRDPGPTAHSRHGRHNGLASQDRRRSRRASHGLRSYLYYKYLLYLLPFEDNLGISPGTSYTRFRACRIDPHRWASGCLPARSSPESS